jgi:hypothetical protein
LDSCGLGYESVAGSCKQGDENSGSMKRGGGISRLCSMELVGYNGIQGDDRRKTHCCCISS